MAINCWRPTVFIPNHSEISSLKLLPIRPQRRKFLLIMTLPCSVCRKEFATQQSLRQHQKAKHTLYTCEICHRGSFIERGLVDVSVPSHALVSLPYLRMLLPALQSKASQTATTRLLLVCTLLSIFLWRAHLEISLPGEEASGLRWVLSARV